MEIAARALAPLLILVALPAHALEEDAAHRADRQRTEQLNRQAGAVVARRDRANDKAQDRYQDAMADYREKMAQWRREVAACRAGGCRN